MILELRGGLAIPLVCYDPLWVELREAADCADLIPPQASLLQFSPSGTAEGDLQILERGPYKGAGVGRWVALQVQPKAQAGFAVWPADRQLQRDGEMLRADLDGDGSPEWAHALP